MGKLFKALLKLLKGKVKIHLGPPGSGIDINFDKTHRPMGLISQGDVMEYSIGIGLLKALRAVGLALLVLLLNAGGIDVLFDTLTTHVGLLGLPVWAVPVVAGAVSLGRNFLKQLAKKVPTA